jgi:hypothetical protein
MPRRSASALADADVRGAGVDQEAHGLAVDRAVGEEVAGAVRGQHDLAGLALDRRAAAEIDLSAAERQGDAPALDLDDRIGGLHTDEAHIVDLGADRQRARATVDDQQRLVAESAAERNGLRPAGRGREQQCGAGRGEAARHVSAARRPKALTRPLGGKRTP